MPNIIRIRNLEQELNLNGAIFPIDNSGYTSVGKQVSILDIKNYILSGFTGGTSGGSGTSGTSGVDGILGINGTSGTSGTTPCFELESNHIVIGIYEYCDLEGNIDCYY
jgi:hypothetical protein